MSAPADFLTVRVCKYLRAAPCTVTMLCDVFPVSRKKMKTALYNLRSLGHIAAQGRINREASYKLISAPAPAVRPTLNVGYIEPRQQPVPKLVGEVVRPLAPEWKPLRNYDPFENWRLRDGDEFDTSRAAVHSYIRG